MRRMHIPALLIAVYVTLVTAGEVHAAAFADIDAEHPYADAIVWLKENGYVGGFSDGTFRSERTVTRAEALKIIVSATGDDGDVSPCPSGQRPYTDVSGGEWFAPYVCAGIERGIIVPDDTKLFRPGDPINVAETAVILARAEKMEPVGSSEPWFAPSLRALGRAQAIPSQIRAYGERVTRGQLAEMLWRMETAVTDREAADAEALIAAQCEWHEHEDVPGVDDQEIARIWLDWVNGERIANGLTPYRPDKHLSRTAATWSVSARDTGSITHKRAGQTAYYDYGIMTDWFADNGLEFANNGGSTFTENIGWGVYRCAEGQDCTGAFTKAVRTTFDFFMSEKGKAYRPHYNSIVNGDFRLAGFGIAVDPAKGRYYLTAHYGTDVTSSPDPICP